MAEKKHAVNEAIKAAQVRLVGSDGSQLGIMTPAEAQRIADEQNLDLVLIAPQAQPPVCRIMDYGKYRFEQQKREKEAQKNQKTVEVKEVRLSLNIGQHDFDVKAGHARRFLSEGNKIKVSIRFRGREMAHANRGTEVMQRFADAMQDLGAVDKPPKLEGRSMQMFLTPKPQAKTK